MAEDNRNRDDDFNRPRKQDRSSSEKGKEKGKQSDASLASRIQDSATGLARNAFYTPGRPQELARNLPGGSKAEPSQSTSFERSSSQAVADQYGPSSASASSREQGVGVLSETFRSSSTSASQQGQFDLPPLAEEELLRTHDTGAYDGTEVEKGKGKARDTESELNAVGDDRIPSHFDTAWEKASLETPSIATTPQQPSDGAPVVSILSEPAFDPEFPPSANEPFEPIDTELSPLTLTPEEVRTIELFRRHVPSESSDQQSQSRRINQFSLIPGVGSFLDSIPAGSGTDATALRDDVLTSLPGAADWMAVEERYHDEVWGYLRPTLEAAAKEMEEKTDPQKTEDGPAVQRLKMILKHMQG